MDKFLFAITGVLIALMAGCLVHAAIAEAEDNPEYETIVVAGMEREVAVESEKMLVLVVSGSYNKVWVEEDTQLKEVVLSGTGNLVYISSSHHPKMTRGGMRNLILRYN